MFLQHLAEAYEGEIPPKGMIQSAQIVMCFKWEGSLSSSTIKNDKNLIWIDIGMEFIKAFYSVFYFYLINDTSALAQY